MEMKFRRLLLYVNNTDQNQGAQMQTHKSNTHTWKKWLLLKRVLKMMLRFSVICLIMGLQSSCVQFIFEENRVFCFLFVLV